MTSGDDGSQTSGMLVSQLIREGEGALPYSSTPRLDAELLLAHVLSVSRSGLFARLREQVADVDAERFRAFLQRRSTGEPLAYITGRKEFWGLDFFVSPAVLVPRPETELVVEHALSFVRGKKRATFADLGTGSGCLAVSITKEMRGLGIDCHCTAVDISPDALAVARSNAVRHGVSEAITFVESDWWSNREAFLPLYTFVVANPPYIDRSESCPPELGFEPEHALFSDQNGLADATKIVGSLAEFLEPGGIILMEVGAGKREFLSDWFEARGTELRLDLLGDESPSDRFTVLRMQKKE